MGDELGPVQVVETADVTDERLTEIINSMIGKGWRLDTIHFAMREASRRPAMAFLVFYRPDAATSLGMK